MKLISMTDFVLEQEIINGGFGQDEIDKVWEYANFLKQPLELWMFIPCDEKGNVLEEPESLKGFYETHSDGMIQEAKLRKQYYEAKDRVLFEGFQISTKGSISIRLNNIEHILAGFKSIEELVKYNLTLTESAIKQLGL